MRILGLDLGSKRIGVALSDELGLTAQPLLVLERRSRAKDIQALGELIEAHQVEEVVLGLPRRLSGELGPEAEKVQVFGRELAEVAGRPVTYWDERLSTVSAERVLLQADVSRAKRKRVIDKVAASIILQGYLDRLAARGAPA